MKSLADIRVHKALLLVATVLALAFAIRVFVGYAPLALLGNVDLGWLIQFGDDTLMHGVPTRLTYCWTFPGRPVVTYQWLFQVAVALIHSTGGLWLIGLASCLISG